MLHHFALWLAGAVQQFGYPGIVLLMFLESSFFPFPSEVVVPPAGYLAAQGEMSLSLVILAGVSGSLLGALFNYWLAVQWGRPLFVKYGRYVLISEKSLDKADRFFAKHGHISTFVGRLLPGIRQYISLPAGLARMDPLLFAIFTTMGAGVWVIILAMTGYWFGNNQELIAQHLHEIAWGIIGLSGLIVAGYIFSKRPKDDSRK